MRRNVVEAKVLEILERVERGQPVEDTFVELKREWLADHSKAARRLGGLANAARGEPVLWIVGVDEDAHAVPGAPEQELANWLPAVERCFDEAAPTNVLSLAVPYKGVTVSAMVFATDAAPYVVKNPTGGPITLDVPWRQGTRVFSARRQDLLRILAPISELPEVELLEAELEVHDGHGGENSVWNLRATIYVIPPLGKTSVIPRHRCSASFSGPYNRAETGFDEVRLCLAQHGDPEHREDAEAVVECAGRVKLIAKATIPGVGGQALVPAQIQIAMTPVHAAGAVRLRFELQHSFSRAPGHHRWTWVPAGPNPTE